MGLDNYRDLSTGSTSMNAGYQFEFYCTSCSSKWKSPFKPYRIGQLSGLLARFGFLFGNANTATRASMGVSDYGSRSAWETALAEAKQQADSRYTECSKCKSPVCDDCLNPSTGLCQRCVERAHADAEERQNVYGRSSASAGGHACPNCSTPGSGGRFCAECGFDMASTHKSCPGCGAMAERSARFCGDCGHGF